MKAFPNLSSPRIKKKRVILADQFPISVMGLEYLLKQEIDLDVVKKASTGTDVLRIIESHDIDLVIMGISMPELNGMDTAEIIKKYYPKIKIIFFTAYNSPEIIKKAEMIGVEGYLLKSEVSGGILEVIRQVLDGFFKYKVHEWRMPSVTPIKIADLTLRETEVFRLMAYGKSSTEIARELNISPKTVQCHHFNIKNKLNINNNLELIKLALRHKLINIEVPIN